MMQSLLITVILNTNRRNDTLEALDSLQKNDYQNHQMIVLDNASSDGSIEAIRERFPGVQVIELDENRGYAGNNNIGIRAAIEQGADWVLVLNEDTRLAPDCLSTMVAAGEDSPATGIVGPMVYHYSDPNVIQSAGGRIGPGWRAWHLGQNEPDRGQFSKPQFVEWVSGCAIMVRRPVIEQTGMLDERFFYYYEETEWCLRAQEGGWKILHVPQAKLWHKGVQINYKPGPNVTYYGTRNRFLMLAKHKAPASTWAIAWLQTLRTLTSWSIRPKWRNMREHRQAMWQGTLDFLAHRWGMRR